MCSISINKSDNAFYITWKSVPIPVSDYKLIVKESTDNISFAPINSGNECAGMLKCYQALSIRSAVNRQYIVSNHWILKKYGQEMTAMYNRGEDIKTIYSKYNYSPMRIILNIFNYNNINVGHISNIIKAWKIGMKYDEHPFAHEYITEQDYNNLNICLENDFDNPISANQSADIAKLKENNFVNYLRKHNIKLQDEDELRATGSRLTPDVLFIDEVYINSERVYWMDFKNYVGTTISLLYNSNIAQVNKYTSEFGRGALCYAYSFIAGLKVKSAILLDGSCISQ